MSGRDRTLRVRMYRVGFGDCFLIRFRGGHHMLIDCGSLAADAAELGAVARDIVRETRGKIEVVVASHRHRDHVAGFGADPDLWAGVEVAEVWLPWTEDPENPDAVRLRARKDAIATSIRPRATGLAATLANNSLTDGDAMEVLLRGFKGRPRRRFLEAHSRESEVEVLPGVSLRVAGPERSEAVVNRVDLECSIAERTVEAASHGGSPFASEWHLTERAARGLFRAELRGRPVLEEVDGSGAYDETCFWLDKAVNNTSLMLLLRCGRTRLLLPGDAQGDAWLPFLEERDLIEALAEVDLYKVSHHGSHNGTPQRISSGLGRTRSLLSTASKACAEIPLASVVAALARKGPVARTDRSRPARGVVVGPRWIDVSIRG